MMKLVFAADHMQILLEPGVKRIGSAPDADIVLRGEGMLPQHCELQVNAQGVMLKIARGAPVSVNQRLVDGLLSLRPGDQITFDTVEATLVVIEAVRPGERVASPVIDDVNATTVRAALPKYTLRAKTGRMLGRSYPLTGATVVGRAPECQLRLDDTNLSRKHAKLIPTNEGVVIEDLGSTNGSFHNGKRVQRAVAQPGDEIGFDTLRFQLLELGQEGTVATPAARVGVPRWVWLVAALSVVAALVFALR